MVWAYTSCSVRVDIEKPADVAVVVFSRAQWQALCRSRNCLITGPDNNNRVRCSTDGVQFTTHAPYLRAVAKIDRIPKSIGD